MSTKIITKDNFDAEVLKESKTVLLDFWASWCGPCRMVSPIIDEIANERTDLKVGKVNVDEQPELAAKFGVMSIPTLIVMKDGKVVEQGPSAAIFGDPQTAYTRALMAAAFRIETTADTAVVSQ